MTTVIDETGNLHTGTIVGAPTFSLGKIGLAINLDGINDYITIEDAATLNLPAFTYLAWVNVIDFADHRPIIANYGNIGSVAGARFRVSDTGILEFLIGNNSGTVEDVNYKHARSINTVTTNTWVLAGATFNGAEMKVYLSGKLEATEAWGSGIAYPATNTVLIGAHSDDGGATIVDLMYGGMDEPKILNGALSELEMHEVFHANPKTFLEQMLLSFPTYWWKVDETTGLTAAEEIQGKALAYESNASTAGYTVESSVFDGVGAAKSLATIQRQIYDAATGIGLGTEFNAEHYAYTITAGPNRLKTLNAVVVPSTTLLIVNNNRYASAGSNTDDITTMNQRDLGLNCELLTTDARITRSSTSTVADARVNLSTFEYSGIAGGPNSFILRGEGNALINGGTTFVNVTVAGVVDKDKCVCMITGVLTEGSDATSSNYATAIAYMTSTTNMYLSTGYVESIGTNVEYRIIEFTGSNWTIHHGLVTAQSADEGTISMTDASDGAGAASQPSSWTKAFIIGQFNADSTLDVHYALADVYPIYKPSDTAGAVDWKFTADHDSDGENEHYVAVVEHSELSVTRYSSVEAAATSGETIVDISGSQLSDLNKALIIGFSITTGTGTALARGSRNYDINDLTTASHWCHRSGNAMEHELQIINFAGVGLNIADLTTEDFTIEVAFTIDSAVLNMHLFGKNTNNTCWNLRLDSADANILKLDLFQSDGTDRSLTICSDLSAVGVLADSAWNWISIRMDFTGIQILDCIINNQPAVSQDVTTWTPPWRTDNASRFTIGADDKDGTDIWSGSNDHPRLYEFAIANDRRQENYFWWKYGAGGIVIVEFTVDIATTDITDSVPAGEYSTPLLTATVTDGAGPFTYLWSSNGSNLTPNNPTSASTVFIGDEVDITTTETLTCTVTDLGDDDIQKSDAVTTNITWGTEQVTLEITPATLNTTEPPGAYTSGIFTAITSLGTGPFTFLWSSNGAHLTPDTPTSISTTFSGTEDGVTTTEILKCVVTDTFDATTAEATVQPNSITWQVTGHTVDVDPLSLSETASGAHTTPLFTATVNDGLGPFQYLWESGQFTETPALTPDTPTASTTTFSGTETNLVYAEWIRVKVVDEGNAHAVAYSDWIAVQVTWSSIGDFKAHWSFDSRPSLNPSQFLESSANAHHMNGNTIPDTRENPLATAAALGTTDIGGIGYGYTGNGNFSEVPWHVDFEGANLSIAFFSLLNKDLGDASSVFWFKFWGTILTVGTATKGFQIKWTSSGLKFTISNGTSTTLTLPIIFDGNFGDLHHLVFTYDGTTMKIIDDGVTAATKLVSNGLGYEVSGNKFYVFTDWLDAGFVNDSSLSTIDELYFFNRAIPDSEALALKNMPKLLSVRTNPYVFPFVITPPGDYQLVDPSVYYTIGGVNWSPNAQAAGGSGNYTFEWSKISGTTMNIDGSYFVDTITVSGQGSSEKTTDIWQVTATDTITGQTATTEMAIKVNWDGV